MSLDKIKPYAKAVMAGVVAAAGAVATGYADELLSTGEKWMAISAGLTAAGATWVIPNAAKTRSLNVAVTAPNAERLFRGNRGHVTVSQPRKPSERPVPKPPAYDVIEDGHGDEDYQ